MNRTVTYLTLSLIMFLLASCNEKKMLSDAEAMLEINPVATNSLLEAMPQLTGKNKAIYAILKTQAEYKQYKPIESDSLILFATEYYGTRKKSYHAAMAWYSLGCVYSDMQKELEAINAYLKAKELFPDTLIRYYALTEQCLGKLYLNQMMFEPSLSNLSGCLKNSLRLHDNVLTSNVRYLIGLNALYQADYVAADSLFNLLLKDPQASSLRSRQCYLNLAKIQLHGYHNYQKSMYYIDRYLYELQDPSEIGVGYSVKADIYYDAEQYDSALYYYEKSMECPSELYTVCDNSGKLAVLSIIKGQSNDAIEYIKFHDELIDSIYDLRKDVAIEEITRKHQIALKDNEIRYRNSRYLIIGISLFLLLLLCILLWMASNLNRKAKLQIQEQYNARNNSIEIMKAHIMDTPFNDKHLSRESIIKLYKNKLDTCKNAFRETQAYSILSSKLIKNDYSFDATEKTEIINQISESFIDSILDMNIEISNLSREDIFICILSSMNYNNRLISAFINISESGIRKRKLRLDEKASKDYVDLFI